MPAGFYKRTEYHRKKISEAMKGLPSHRKGKKGCYSEETKKKMSLAQKGKKLSKETREKLSEMRKGKKHWAFGKVFSKKYCRKMSEAHKGYKHTEEQKMKIGLKSKGNKYRLGKKNSKESNLKRSKILKGKYIGKLASGWRGGKSFEPYGIKFNKELKEKVRKRDKYKCQECSFIEKKL